MGEQFQFKLFQISLLSIPCQYVPLYLAAELLSPAGDPLRGTCKTAHVSANFCGIHWTCSKLTHSLIGHKVDVWPALLNFSALFLQFSFSQQALGSWWGSETSKHISNWRMRCLFHYTFLVSRSDSLRISYLISGDESFLFFSPSFCLCLVFVSSSLILLPLLPELWLCLYRLTGVGSRLVGVIVEGGKSVSPSLIRSPRNNVCLLLFILVFLECVASIVFLLQLWVLIVSFGLSRKVLLHIYSFLPEVSPGFVFVSTDDFW